MTSECRRGTNRSLAVQVSVLGWVITSLYGGGQLVASCKHACLGGFVCGSACRSGCPHLPTPLPAPLVRQALLNRTTLLHAPAPDTPSTPHFAAHLPAHPPAAEGVIAGTRKYSAHKAGGGLVVGAIAATAAMAPLLGLDPWAMVNIETGFTLAASASLAGGWEGGREGGWEMGC